MSKQSDWENELYELSGGADDYGHCMIDVEKVILLIRQELAKQRKELIEIVEQAHDKDFGTYDYKAIAEKVIELVKNESRP